MREAEIEAIELVKRVLAKPMARTQGEIGNCNPDGSTIHFDPWDLFPAVYGSYSSEFDDLAIEILSEQLELEWNRSDLASEIFKEMLCVANLCDYGTSPRSCFPRGPFADLLPELIEKWKAYRALQWSES